MSISDIRGKIAAAKDIKSEPFYSPAWDVNLEIRGMSGAARGQLMAGAYDEEGKVDYAVFYPMLIIATVCDPETHEPVFTAGDVEFLNGKSAEALEQVATVAMRLSGLSKGDITSAEKNSATGSASSTESVKLSGE